MQPTTSTTLGAEWVNGFRQRFFSPANSISFLVRVVTDMKQERRRKVDVFCTNSDKSILEST